MKVLVIFSHSYQQASVGNKAILEELSKTSDYVVRNLEELYPDGKFDVEKEQQFLVDADVIVFQHPMFWFSVPSMLKKYMDDVLTHGFAYGTGGDKLHGKKFYHSFTTGGTADSYTEEALDNFTSSIRASANFCGMEYAGRIVTSGLNAYTNSNIEADAREHAHRLVATIKG